MDRKMILPIGKEGENMQGLVVEGFNFQPLWSPDGKQLVYSTAGQHSNYQPLLWAVDGTPSSMGENRRSLGLNTWAEKCAFADNATMYCAVPTDLQSRAGIRPGGVPTNTEDELYRVNIQSGRTSLVAIPEEDTSINEPSVSPDGTRLFYRNVEGQLETIRLD
jgi:Tol biopolymer transport system component